MMHDQQQPGDDQHDADAPPQQQQHQPPMAMHAGQSTVGEITVPDALDALPVAVPSDVMAKFRSASLSQYVYVLPVTRRTVWFAAFNPMLAPGLRSSRCANGVMLLSGRMSSQEIGRACPVLLFDQQICAHFARHGSCRRLPCDMTHRTEEQIKTLCACRYVQLRSMSVDDVADMVKGTMREEGLDDGTFVGFMPGFNMFRGGKKDKPSKKSKKSKRRDKKRKGKSSGSDSSSDDDDEASSSSDGGAGDAALAGDVPQETGQRRQRADDDSEDDRAAAAAGPDGGEPDATKAEALAAAAAARQSFRAARRQRVLDAARNMVTVTGELVVPDYMRVPPVAMYGGGAHHGYVGGMF